MPLEDHGSYVTVSGNRARMRWTVDIVSGHFSYQIMRILGISSDAYFADLDRIHEENHVLSGLTDDPTMPGGFWHQETGKCLWGNTGWVVGHGEKLENFLSWFDIKVD